MKIRYNFKENFYEYFENNQGLEKEKLSFLLTNLKGDFLNMGFNKNPLKNNGFFKLNEKNNQLFKVIDSISLNNVELKKVVYEGFKVRRIFKSNLIADEINEKNLLEDNEFNKSDISNKSNISIESNEKLENIHEKINDNFYMPSIGGLIYEINNFEGELILDLDIREMNDFSDRGRYYETYKKNGILFVKYIKKNEERNIIEYEVLMGIKTVNFDYKIIENWIKKEYPYSKYRSEIYSLYNYRFLKININGNKRIFFSFGFNEDEIIKEMDILEKHQKDLEDIDRELYDKITEKPNFDLPIPEENLTAYRISHYSIFKFLRQNIIKKEPLGFVAGFPWFSQIWTRDELIGLKAFINNGDYDLVKSRLFYYLNLLKENNGLLPRLNINGSLNSPDGVFWLAKRLDDLIYALELKEGLETKSKQNDLNDFKNNKLKFDQNNLLNSILSNDELNLIYDNLSYSFEKILENYWDDKIELLRVNDGDPWMDTIHVEYPVDMQVLLLNFTSFLAFLSQILNREKEKTQKYLDFEKLLKDKIRSEYYKDYILSQEPNKKVITSNIFLVYYIYPELFYKKDWEIIFERGLELLQENGLISTISRNNINFKGNYTGENNASYHNGDSWFWINNIAAMSMYDLNEKKFRNNISKIIINSTKDILKKGVIGFGSELSSASKLKAEGSLAQFWSSTTYIEMIDLIFKTYK